MSVTLSVCLFDSLSVCLSVRLAQAQFVPVSAFNPFVCLPLSLSHPFSLTQNPGQGGVGYSAGVGVGGGEGAARERRSCRCRKPRAIAFIKAQWHLQYGNLTPLTHPSSSSFSSTFPPPLLSFDSDFLPFLGVFRFQSKSGFE